MSGRARPPARDPFGTAVRVLAHRLLHRADRLGQEPHPDAALRLADERLVPSRAARRRVATQAERLCLAALAERRPGGRLDGELRENVRVGLRRRDGSARVVLIPSLILDRERGGVSVLTMQDGDTEAAERRVRRYQAAARVLYQGPVRAFVARPEGTLEELRRAASRTGPRAAAYPGRECSPSGRPQSGRRPR